MCRLSLSLTLSLPDSLSLTQSGGERERERERGIMEIASVVISSDGQRGEKVLTGSFISCSLRLLLNMK